MRNCIGEHPGVVGRQSSCRGE